MSEVAKMLYFPRTGLGLLSGPGLHLPKSILSLYDAASCGSMYDLIFDCPQGRLARCAPSTGFKWGHFLGVYHNEMLALCRGWGSALRPAIE